MRFGIFDHMDDTGRPVSEQYESRLQLIEAYDRCGFHYYHLAKAYAQKGENAKASGELREALKHSPQREEQQEIQDMLAKMGGR